MRHTRITNISWARMLWGSQKVVELNEISVEDVVKVSHLNKRTLRNKKGAVDIGLRNVISVPQSSSFVGITSTEFFFCWNNFVESS